MGKISFRKIDSAAFEECKPLDANDRYIVTCTHIVERCAPVLLVVRCKEFRGKPLYQYLCSPDIEHTDASMARFLCPHCMAEKVGSPSPVPELAVGQHAVRKNALSPWVVGEDKEEAP